MEQAESEVAAAVGMFTSCWKPRLATNALHTQKYHIILLVVSSIDSSLKFRFPRHKGYI